MWIVGDLESPDAINLITEGLQAMVILNFSGSQALVT